MIVITREQAEHSIIQYLNQNNLHGASTYYHFGILGTLWIHWRTRWVTEWIEVELLPEGMVNDG